MGWQKAGDLGKDFSAVFIRDKEEQVEIKSHIEATIEIMKSSSVKLLELQTQGKSKLAKMISTITSGFSQAFN